MSLIVMFFMSVDPYWIIALISWKLLALIEFKTLSNSSLSVM